MHGTSPLHTSDGLNPKPLANSHGKTRSAQTSQACPADPSQQHRSKVCIQASMLDTMPAMAQAVQGTGWWACPPGIWGVQHLRSRLWP